MFLDDLKAAQDAISAHLTHCLAGLGDAPVVDAMRYAVSGGKRLRGFLVLETAKIAGADPRAAMQAAAAVECIHAYSLVHDDMPCMDDDDLRRGLPTVHRKWDEATAVLVGDGLQTLAFDLLADPVIGSAEIRVALIGALAKAAGASGMVLGQAQDMAAEKATTPLDLSAVTELQANKTGALLEWPAFAGATLGGADPAPLTAYARAIGLAFQIADDILDVTGDPEKAGKRLGKDEAAGKATFVSLLGLDGARARAAALIDEAEAALAPYDDKAHVLKDLARYITSRDQ